MKKQSNIHESNRNYWKKRTASQYAYYKSMNIDPDEIAKIEESYKEFYEKMNTDGLGILERIELEDKARKEGTLKKFPSIPNDRLVVHVIAKNEWENTYL